MILFLSTLAMLIGGLIMVKKSFKDFVQGIGLGSAIIGGIGFVICCGLIIVSNNKTINKQISEEVKYEKAVIEYRIDDQINTKIGSKLLYDDVFLYEDIVEFNEKLLNRKINKNSLWTNWMESNAWEEIGFIEIPNLDYEILEN